MKLLVIGWIDSLSLSESGTICAKVFICITHTILPIILHERCTTTTCDRHPQLRYVHLDGNVRVQQFSHNINIQMVHPKVTTHSHVHTTNGFVEPTEKSRRFTRTGRFHVIISIHACCGVIRTHTHVHMNTGNIIRKHAHTHAHHRVRAWWDFWQLRRYIYSKGREDGFFCGNGSNVHIHISPFGNSIIGIVEQSRYACLLSKNIAGSGVCATHAPLSRTTYDTSLTPRILRVLNNTSTSSRTSFVRVKTARFL